MFEQAARSPLHQSDTTTATLAALDEVTSLGWAILKTQAQLAGCRPEALTPHDLHGLIEPLAKAVERFTSPAKAHCLRKQLRELIDSVPPASHPRCSSRAAGRPSSHAPVDADSFAGRVLAELQRFSPLAWPLLEAQCKRAGIDPTRLTPLDLANVIESVERSLARFSSPEKARQACLVIERLS